MLLRVSGGDVFIYTVLPNAAINPFPAVLMYT
jgi:hypothetical protein